jgi:hypothetical protein
LESRGPAALPMLHRAISDNTELEVRRRLERCIAKIEALPWPDVIAAAGRRLAALRTPGASGVLMDCLPLLHDELSASDLHIALLRLSSPPGPVDPAVARALEQSSPARRAAAALVLGAYGDEKQRAAVRRVLQTDLYLSVRLRAAEGLLRAGDSSPVPVLLAVLEEGNADLALVAEELLLVIAGKAAPPEQVSAGPDVRRKVVRAWHHWWEAEGRKLDLPTVFKDDFETGPNELARRKASRFLDAFVRGDAERLRALTTTPFAVAMTRRQLLSTRQELDEEFKKEVGRETKPKITWSVGAVRPLRAILPRMPEDAREILEKLVPARVRAVEILLGVQAYIIQADVYVRIERGRAFVVGIGSDKK